MTNETIIATLRPIIWAADLEDESVTAKTIRKELEERLGTDLTEKKAFLKQQITEMLLERQKEGEEEEEDEDEDENEDEEEEEEEDEAPTPKRRRAAAAPKQKAKKREPASGGGGRGFGMVDLSPTLGDLLGTHHCGRTEVTKLLWVYIKEHDLQNPADKREIVLDAPMREVFGQKVRSFTMFAMAKHVSSHLTKSDDDGDGGGGGGGSAKKRPRASKAAAAGGDKPKREQPKQKLSPALAAIVGAGTMARPQVVKALWEYIREHDLQNPADKREIVCDATFKKVMGGNATVTMFSMNKFLGPHFLGKAHDDDDDHEGGEESK